MTVACLTSEKRPSFSATAQTLDLFGRQRRLHRVVERLRGAVAQTMQSPEMRNRLHEGGWRIVTLSSAQTETFLKSEADRWIPLLRRARAIAAGLTAFLTRAGS
jgi:tripartite-type tricarboxylate transporter receptor subunit TctC